MGAAIEQYCNFDGGENSLEALHLSYLSHLYRYDGKSHLFTVPGDDTPFMAAIVDVDPDGMLTLRHPDDTLHRYAFKEVTFII